MEMQARRIGTWYLLLSLLISLLIIVGGTVRLTESGLSIPEWPIINGSLLPPFTAQGWETVYNTYYLQIHKVDLEHPEVRQSTDASQLLSMRQFKTMFAIEYTHRLLAALVSMLFLALMVQVMRHPTLRQQIGSRVIALAGMLLFQAVLGGIVVKLDLKAEFVAVHLGIAFIFFAAIFWLGMRLSWPGAPRLAANSRVRRWSWGAMIAVYIQVILGGMVAATKAGYILNTWPHMGQSVIPSGPSGTLLWLETIEPGWLNLLQNQTLIQFMHRWWALVPIAAIFGLAIHLLRQPISERARWGIRAATSLVVFQFLLGVATLLMIVPKGLAIMHLGCALILFAILVLITYEISYESQHAR